MGKFQSIDKVQVTFIYLLLWAFILLLVPIFLYGASGWEDMSDGVPMVTYKGKNACAGQLVKRTVAEKLEDLSNPNQLNAIFLSGCSLSAVPKVSSNHNIVRLSLGDNKLTRIHKNDLRFFVCLEDLYLANNQIDTIDSGALAIESLRILTLSNNKLRALSKEIFMKDGGLSNSAKDGGLSTSIEGEIDEGQVEAGYVSPWVDEGVEGAGADRVGVEIARIYLLNKLEQLDVSHNSIETIEPGLLCLLPCLKVFCLSDNCIKKLTQESFEGMRGGLGNIIKLDLRFNYLEHIDTEIMTKFSNKLWLSLFQCSRDVQNRWREADRTSKALALKKQGDGNSGQLAPVGKTWIGAIKDFIFPPL